MPRLILFTVSCVCIRAQDHTLVRNPGVESGFPDQISYHVMRLPTKKRLMLQVSYHDSRNRLWTSIFCVNVHIVEQSYEEMHANLSTSGCAIMGTNIRVCSMADYSASFRS